MTKPHEINPATLAVTGNFTLTAQLPQGKSLSISGYLYDRESFESVSARIDVLHDALDRQRTRAEIPELEVKMDQSVARLEEIKTHYAAMDKKQSSGMKLTKQELDFLNVRDINVNKHLDDIEKGRKAVADARAALVLPEVPAQ